MMKTLPDPSDKKANVRIAPALFFMLLMGICVGLLYRTGAQVNHVPEPDQTPQGTWAKAADVAEKALAASPDSKKLQITSISEVPRNEKGVRYYINLSLKEPSHAVTSSDSASQRDVMQIYDDGHAEFSKIKIERRRVVLPNAEGKAAK